MHRAHPVPSSRRLAPLLLGGFTAGLLLCGCVSARFDGSASDGGPRDAQMVVGDARQGDNSTDAAINDSATNSDSANSASGLPSDRSSCVVGHSKLGDCVLQ